MLYEILKTSKLGASFAPDMYTALWAQKLARDGEVKALSGAPPLSFQANGQPLLDYLIEGNTVQNGTPTPDTPIMPQGTGERTGNLFNESNFALVQVTSTAYRYGTSLGVLPQGGYTFNATKPAGAQSIYLTAKLNGVYSQTTISSVPFSFTADGDSEYIIRTANNTGTTWEAEKYSDMMLNTGSTPLPYEPYGYKIPISSANTTTPVYLGEVETTRKIKKYEFTGQESIYADLQYSRFIFTLNDSLIIGVRKTPAFCTHWQVIDDGRTIANVPNNALYSDSENSRWFIKTTDYTTADDFKSYLATQYANGTPVCVWYILATEETGIVNEPLMRIGDYADTVSYEQAGVQIPTARGTNTLDVLTDVKPSNVYLKYKEV